MCAILSECRGFKKSFAVSSMSKNAFFCHLERSREICLGPRAPVRAPGVTFVLLTVDYLLFSDALDGVLDLPDEEVDFKG